MKENEPNEFFVPEGSVVRKIWGKSDTILFVFAGASAEFALNKAVDWLYFTGRLPADPLGRLFSTVKYARRIVFATTVGAHQAIDQIVSIHSGVEKSRGAQIPDWAYRDVLFMLIHYSMAAHELLERKLTNAEKDGLFDVFYRMGERMKIKGLPLNYEEWMVMREQHLRENLKKTKLTADLYKQYKKHLGGFRFRVLLETQKLLVPPHVNNLLGFSRVNWISPLLIIYKWSRSLRLDRLIKEALLPNEYLQQVKQLDTEEF